MMDTKKLMDAMAYMDPALIEAADPAPAKRKAWRRPALIAACLCLALVGTAVAVNSGVVVEFFTGSGGWDHLSEEPITGGFEINAEGVQIVPVDSLPREVRDLAAAQESAPCFYGFDSWDEAEQFLGLELANNPVLDEAETWENTYSFEDPETNRLLNSATGESIVRLGVNIDDLFVRIYADAFYKLDGVAFTLSADIVTDQMPYDDPWGTLQLYHGDELDRVTREEYLMSCGKTALIIGQPPLEVEGRGERENYEAFFVQDNCLISLKALETWDDVEGNALETLKQVLDGFE